MAEQITYYALIRPGDSERDPSGLARRRVTRAGRLDEVLRRNLTWARDSAIYEWERGEEMGTRLQVITREEAEQLINRFREKWAGADE